MYCLFEIGFQNVVIKTKNKLKQTKGRKKQDVMSQNVRFHVIENEMLSREELRCEEVKTCKFRLANPYQTLLET